MGVGDARTSTNDDAAKPSFASGTPARAMGVVSSLRPRETMSDWC